MAIVQDALRGDPNELRELLRDDPGVRDAVLAILRKPSQSGSGAAVGGSGAALSVEEVNRLLAGQR